MLEGGGLKLALSVYKLDIRLPRFRSGSHESEMIGLRLDRVRVGNNGRFLQV